MAEEYEPLKYEDLKLPNYRNSASIANVGGVELSFCDTFVFAPELGCLNVLYACEPGWGKTQLITDLRDYHFGGVGKCFWQDGRPDLDPEELFEEFDLEKYARREGSGDELRKLTGRHKKLAYFLNEINRCPGPTQNKFLGIGEGSITHKDRKVELGEEGYAWIAATANIGDGDLSGTFELDRALLGRLPIGVDMDSEMYKPTEEDMEYIRRHSGANPRVISSSTRDISGKILQAYKEISGRTGEKNEIRDIALRFLSHGLKHCRLKETKKRRWPQHCQSCDYNKLEDNSNLCSLINRPDPRSERAILKYSESLKYIAKLKEPDLKDEDINSAELVFTAFGLSGTYHGILNLQSLNSDYDDERGDMMEGIRAKLSEEFGKQRGNLEMALEESLVKVKIEGETFIIPKKDLEGRLKQNPALKEKIKKKIYKFGENDAKIPVSWSWFDRYLIRRNQGREKQ